MRKGLSASLLDLLIDDYKVEIRVFGLVAANDRAAKKYRLRLGIASGRNFVSCGFGSLFQGMKVYGRIGSFDAFPQILPWLE